MIAIQLFLLVVDICKKCDINAKCINDTCVCVEGFYGNGFTCRSKDEVNFLEKLYRNYDIYLLLFPHHIASLFWLMLSFTKKFLTLATQILVRTMLSAKNWRLESMIANVLQEQVASTVKVRSTSPNFQVTRVWLFKTR